MSLIAAGSSVKVINAAQNCSLVTEYVDKNFPTQEYNNAAWSRDGKWVVATTSNPRSPLVFRYKEEQLLRGYDVEEVLNCSSCEYFATTNRFLAVGTTDGRLLAWDYKSNRELFKFESHSTQPIMQVAVNLNDSLVAASEENATSVKIYGINSRVLINEWYIGENAGVSRVRFSMIKKAMLGVSTIDSDIHVWDANQNKYVYKYEKAHNGACTDLAFSPINELLMTSASLDHSLNMYDVRKKKRISHVKTTKPLTCVEIMADGKYLAVGTCIGTIMIYDLRNLSKELSEIEVFRGHVKRIQSQPQIISHAFKDAQLCTPEAAQDETANTSIDISILDLMNSPAINLPAPSPKLTANVDSFLYMINTPPSNHNSVTPLIRTTEKSKLEDILETDLRKSVLEKSVSCIVSSTPTSNYAMTTPSSVSPIVENVAKNENEVQKFKDIIGQYEAKLQENANLTQELSEQISKLREEVKSTKEKMKELMFDSHDHRTQTYMDLKIAVVMLKMQLQQMESDNKNRHGEVMQFLMDNL